MHNIILIGMRGSGKTRLGKRLAEHYAGYIHMDMDIVLEQQHGKNICDIIECEGIGTFRAYETKMLKAMLQKKGCIISTGGGVVTVAENRRLLANEFVIFLDIPHTTLEERISNDNRLLGVTRPPLCQGMTLTEEIAELWKEREGWYRECATLTFR